MTRGERVCAFIEKYCRCPEGDLVGKPQVLLPFERKFILEVYDNPHGTHTAILSIAKKNGKTSLIADLLIAHTAGPEAVKNSQIVSGARSKEQAATIFELARKIIDMDETLRSLVHVQPSGKVLIGLMHNVTYRALAAEGKTAHGVSPRVVILDELGQVEGPTDPFVAALTTAQGAYKDALLIAISTQAPTDADMLSTWIDRQEASPDKHTVCHVYTAPEGCDIGDREAWAAANPALGHFKSLVDIEKQWRAARDLPALEPEFRNFALNQRVEMSSPFIPKSVWEANGEKPPAPTEWSKFSCGLDLSSVQDLSAFIAIDQTTGGVFCRFWLPKEGLREKARLDKIPYELWEQQGHLHTTPGKAIEYEHIARFLREFFSTHTVDKCGFDRYNMRFLKPWLEKVGFTEKELERFVEFGQGTASMTPALRDFEVKLLNHWFKHGMHPVLNMCQHNVRVVGESGARKFDKKKSRGRIDGMVALAMGVGVMPSLADKPRKFQMIFV